VSNIAQAKPAEISAEKSYTNGVLENGVSIRVSPNGYFIALFTATFYAAFLIYLEYDWASAALLAAAWFLMPFFALTDRIRFDGKRLIRTGYLPRAWNWVSGARNYLKLTDIEQVETQALRALKRGGNVFYRYRTSFQGRGLRMAFASGGEDYRRMIETILPRLPENILDNRSLELRDYLAEPKETLMKAEFAHIPSAEVLENSFLKDSKINRKNCQINHSEIEKADYLRTLGNELRLSGYLLQALEAFRRALVINPQDSWLIFEFARCLHSFAGSERDKKLQSKAFAALRLAEKRAGGDADLLARLGETYFQYGDARRARQAFQKALDKAGESFRSVRGLAEIALREGKIAHVIHHFSTANRLAETAALRRWTRNETEYFTRLNEDEDYMEMEISRINLLEALERSMKTCLRIALLGIPLILFGIVLNDSLTANVGWAVSSISLLIWVGIIVGQKLFSSRIPLDLVEEE
jgi:tetratricopeptide (TPR) repeat protein